MNVETTLSKPESRRRRWVWPIVVPLGTAALFAFLLWYDRYQAERSWVEACAEADRLDPGWRWDELLAKLPTVPDDQHAGRTIRAAAALMPARWPDWGVALRDEDLAEPPKEPDAKPGEAPGAPPDNSPATLEERRGFAVQNLENSFGELPPNQRLSPLQVRAARANIATAGDAYVQTRRLADLSVGGLADPGPRPLIFNLALDDVQKARSVTYLFKLHASLASEEGRHDEALDDCRAIFSAAGASSQSPTLINALVATAVQAVGVGTVERVLAQGEPSSDELRRLQERIAEALEPPLLLGALRGERALIEDLVRSMNEGLLSKEQQSQLANEDVQALSGWATLDGWLHRMRGGGFRKQYAAQQVLYYNAAIELLKISADEPLRNSAELDLVRNRLSGVTIKWIGMTNKIFNADQRGRAMLRTALAAVAAERFRRDKGQWPNSLGGLIPNYLNAVPIDPFDFQPLRYKRLPDGVVIYAVGDDEVDSGGIVRTTPGQPGLPPDVGIRLWDVDKRRQPAPDEKGKP